MQRRSLIVLVLMIIPVMIWVDEPLAEWVATWSVRLASGAAAFSITLASLGVAVAVVAGLMALARPASIQPVTPGPSSGRVATLVLVSAAASFGAAGLLKHLIGRIRPSTIGADPWRFEPLAFDDRFAALPSAQAACIAAVALSLATSFPRLRVLLILAGAAACLARVVAGDHWPSDVMAGWALGAAAVIVTRLGFARRQRRLHGRRS
ncbi:MAG: phosphatase PAP2 family protein [Aurantimonas endophytica]|uniref:phosphatase PAP2 family protein n=1 Tax=Aurantimonas endophytica TaxID=1522175 RepID=UPI003001A969